MVRIFVPDLPEFTPIVDAVRRTGGDCTVVPPRAGYWQIEAPQGLSLSRKELRLRTALWFSLLTGGFTGRLAAYDKDVITIEEEAQT